MPKRSNFSLLTIFSLVFGLIFGVSSEGFSTQMVEVSLRDHDDLEQLLRGGFDVTYLSQDQTADVMLYSDDERTRLDMTGLHYFVVHQNIEAFYSDRLQRGLRRDPMGGYMTFDEIFLEMNELHEDYPDIVGEPISIGRSIEDRDIWAFKVSDNPDEEEDEAEVLYTSLIHAREVITPLVLFGFIRYLADEYEQDDYITNLVNERQMWFIPCHNPDGYVYNEENDPDGGGMWRKNRRDNGDDTWGVDLNRNWGDHWGYDDIGSSPEPDEPTYRGIEAFSEPETQVAREFVNDHSFQVSLYFHSYSNLMLYPPGYDYLQVEDRGLLTALAHRMIAVNHYLPGTGWEIIYPTNGDSDDWLYASDEHDPIMAFTPEVGSREDGFWPDLDRVDQLVAENISTCLMAAEYCEEPARVLRPPSPENVTAIADQNGHPVIRWDITDDDFNPPVGFNVMAQEPGEPFIDDAPEDQDRWDLLNFNMSRVDQHSGTHSYRVATRKAMATMTLREETVMPDTIWAWMNYNLFTFLNHYIALEISYDGYDWEPLPGRDTQDLVINDQNLGPGLTGNTNNEWVHTYFLSGDHRETMARLRFRFYQFSRRFNAEQCFIDDIGPFPGVEWSEVVAEGIEDPIWTDEEHNLEDELEYLVQAIDAEGDLSFWTVPTGVGPAPDEFELTAPTGWMLVSAPIAPDPPDLEDVFAEWIERDALIVVKNGAGQFFAPSRNVNNIGRWNPLEGYWIKIVSADTLLIGGEQIASDTPIPLQEGWNMVAYLPMEPSPAPDALESIADNLIFAKDGHGHFWTLEHDFSNMADLTAGRGYQLKMADDDTLIYPMIGRLNSPIAEHKGANYLNSPLAMRVDSKEGADFTPISTNNHSLLLRLNNLPSGEIVLLDSDGFESGYVIIEDGQDRAGVAAWGESEPAGPGFSAGEPLRAEWRGLENGERIRLNLLALASDDTYRTDGFSVMDVVVANNEELPLDYGILHAYPNPFNSRVSFGYRLEEATVVSLHIFDASGRLIETITMGRQSAGSHRIEWNGMDRPSGVYIAQLDINRSTGVAHIRTKLLLIR